MSAALLELQRALEDAALDDSAQPPHARAFSFWIQTPKSERPLGALDVLAREAAVATDTASRSTAHVATLGYAASVNGQFVAGFEAALAWLMKRKHFVAHRTLTFEVDGLALLGTAIGIATIPSECRDDASLWLREILVKSLDLNRPHDWNESLIAAALSIVSGRAQKRMTGDLHEALASKGIASSTGESRAAAWTVISSLAGLADGMTRAAAQSAALMHLLHQAATINTASASVDDVARVLAGIQHSLRRWPWDVKPLTKNSVAARWDIENEYHVQDLLWIVLAPLFPDLDDEEWLKSLGQHKPRADLAIPSLGLIIEVKFARPAKSAFVNTIKEVAADASTYLQDGSGFKRVIAFVWDDAARTEQHAELRQGLKRIRGVDDAVIVSRPSKMMRRKQAVSRVVQ